MSATGASVRNHEDDDYMTIQVYYGPVRVAEDSFTTSCFVSTEQDRSVGKQIILPKCSPETEETSKTTEIPDDIESNLQDIKGGLLIEYDNNTIYATRRCSASIYYTSYFNFKTSIELKLYQRTEIYCVADVEGSLTTPDPEKKLPTSDVLLACGRRSYYRYDKRTMKPKLDVPISVIVSSKKAENLLKDFKMTHPDNSDDELQISDPEND